MDNKTTAWVSYLTLVGWLIAFLQYKNAPEKDALVRFHLRQMFGLMVSYASVWILSQVMYLGIFPGIWTLQWVLWVALFIFWVMGIVAALNGEEKPVPLVGNLFQQWFAFIG
ncbi:MAG: DUF4870 domain-containing protein [Bacteroidetes bacterium]|nr:DUF4870 domain-containing protein [Bacteroidota bacterium]